MKWVSFVPAVSRRIVIEAAQNEAESVYLSGETGSGKSAIARWIHQNSPRSARPLVTMRPGEDLGTQATAAGNGTLVIQDLEGFQNSRRHDLVTLLRTHSLPIDPARGSGIQTLVRARIIATGEKPIGEFSVFDSLFRNFRIHLPTLGERGPELGDIMESLLTEMAHELMRDHVRSLSKEARAALMAHEWRANFRELRNILRYGILTCSGAVIEVSNLPDLTDPEKLLLGSRAEFRRIEETLIPRN